MTRATPEDVWPLRWFEQHNRDGPLACSLLIHLVAVVVVIDQAPQFLALGIFGLTRVNRDAPAADLDRDCIRVRSRSRSAGGTSRSTRARPKALSVRNCGGWSMTTTTATRCTSSGRASGLSRSCCSSQRDGSRPAGAATARPITRHGITGGQQREAGRITARRPADLLGNLVAQTPDPRRAELDVRIGHWQSVTAVPAHGSAE